MTEQDEGSRYAERLLPRWWAALAALTLPVMLGVAYGSAVGPVAGWLVGLGGVALVLLLLWTTAPRIVVTDEALTVGPARLPRTSIAAVEPVTAADIRRLRGPGADARVYVALRPWSCTDGVLVTLQDPEDPHPAWLFSSRHPARAAEALAATMGR